MIGRPQGISGRIYAEWAGDILRNVPKDDAAQLLEFLGAWEPLVGTEPPASKPAMEPTPTGVVEAHQEPADPEPEEGEEEASYSKEDLQAMSKTELLEFFEEADQEQASKLTKAGLIAQILGED